jgi:hypothetical protein
VEPWLYHRCSDHWVHEPAIDEKHERHGHLAKELQKAIGTPYPEAKDAIKDTVDSMNEMVKGLAQIKDLNLAFIPSSASGELNRISDK